MVERKNTNPHIQLSGERGEKGTLYNIENQGGGKGNKRYRTPRKKTREDTQAIILGKT